MKHRSDLLVASWLFAAIILVCGFGIVWAGVQLLAWWLL
jgi:hypothetical protein